MTIFTGVLLFFRCVSSRGLGSGSCLSVGSGRRALALMSSANSSSSTSSKKRYSPAHYKSVEAPVLPLYAPTYPVWSLLMTALFGISISFQLLLVVKGFRRIRRGFILLLAMENRLTETWVLVCFWTSGRLLGLVRIAFVWLCRLVERPIST